MLPYLVLLRMGFTARSPVAGDPVSSYLTLSPLPRGRMAAGRSTLCGTFLGVTPTRRYLASSPMELGLSSSLRGQRSSEPVRRL